MIFFDILSTLRRSKLYNDVDLFRQRFQSESDDEDSDKFSDDAVVSFLYEFDNCNALLNALIHIGFTQAGAEIIVDWSYSIK